MKLRIYTLLILFLISILNLNVSAQNCPAVTREAWNGKSGNNPNSNRWEDLVNWDDITFTLPNLYAAGQYTSFTFIQGAQFVENSNGTATLTGTIKDFSNPNRRFSVNITLTNQTFSGTPYNVTGISSTNTSAWYYYTWGTATLTGQNELAGASLTLTGRGHPFQFGIGANQLWNQNDRESFGGGGWFSWTVTSQPTNGTTLNNYTAGTDADIAMLLSGTPTTQSSCGNNCSTDNTNPVFATCPSNINLTTSGTTAIATYATPTATDNCSTPSVTRTAGLASGSAFPLGTTTVTHRATDAAGNSATCSFTVTVTQSTTCDNVTTGGTIGANQTICSGTAPATLTNVSSPTGGTGTIEYIWLSSTTGCPTSTSQAIAGATGATYSPTALTQTTYFRRCARRAGCTTYAGESNCITITVADNTIPVFTTCPSNISLTTSGTTAVVTYATPTATDNCSTPSVTRTAGLASGSAFPVGTTTVTYTAIDAAGNQAICTFTVTVTQTTGGSCTKYSVTNTNNICGCSQNLWTPYAIYLATPSGCPGTLFQAIDNIEFTQNTTTGTATLVGIFRDATWAPIPVNITFTGGTTTPPVGSPKLELCQTGAPTSTANGWIYYTGMSGTITINGQALTVTRRGPAFQVGNGANLQNVSVLGGSSWFTLSNNVEGDLNFTLSNPQPCTSDPCANDNTNPVFATCPTNINLTTSGTTAVATYATPTATDNCSTPSVVRTVGLASGSAFPLGTTTVTHRATDAAGNIATCTFTVTVTQTITCNNVTSGGTIGTNQTICSGTVPAPLTSVSLPTGGTGTIEYIWLKSTTGCPTATSQAIAGATGATYSPGILTQTTYFRRCARRSGCTAYVGESNCITITVGDNTNPVFATCPTNINLTTSGTTAIATYATPTATDNCSTPTVTRTVGLASGSAFPLGTTTVTHRATDAAGNIATCTFNVTVTQVIVCDNVTSGGTIGANQTICSGATPAPLTSVSLPTGGTGTIEYIWLSSTTACPTAASQTIAGATGATYSPGALTQTTYFRRCARRSGCTAYVGESNCITITVGDNTNPVFATCPTNINLTTSGTTAVATYATPTATDNCSTPSVVRTVGLASGSAFPLGTTTVTHRATDAAGNIATCTFTVTVTQVIVCNNVTSGGTIGTNQTICSGTVPAPLTSISLPTGGTGTIEYIWLSSTTGCPTATSQAIAGATSATYSPGALTQTTYFRRCARRSGCTAYVGESNCITITVGDVTNPVFATCPTNINLTTSGTTAVATYATPTATDNCSTPTVTRTIGLASGSAFPLGTTTVTHRATDAAGNIATCTFTVTVTQVIVCSNVTSGGTIGTNQTICSGATPAPLTSMSLPTGGTGTIEYIWLKSTTGCPTATSQAIAGATGATYSPGALTQTTYFRRCARRSGCTAYVGESNCITITVGDNTNPVFATCPTNINLTTSGTTAVATYATPTATDNCSTPSVVRTVGLASGSAFPLGTTTVTHRATDAAGNIATCTFTVTVTQVIVCDNVTSGGTIGANQTICSGATPAPLTSISLPTGGTGTIEYIWLSSTTACPTAASQTIAGATSATYSPGALTQTTYFRRCARRAGCTAYVGESNCITITVGDNTNPVFATCPTNINLTTSGTTAVATYATPTATDNCSTPSVVRTVGLASGSAFPLGTTTVTHRATDAAGNIATCTFTVTVTQVIVCDNVTSGGTIGANQTICSGATPAPLTSISLPTGGTGTIEYIWLSSTTACPTAASQAIAGATSATYSPGALTQTTYFRRCARRSGCTAYVGESNCITITVGDNTNPVFATCPTNINLTTSGTTAVATYATPTATDNCSTPTVIRTVGLASGSAFPLGTTTVTHRATDAAGNIATCTFTVTVTQVIVCNNVTSGGTIGTNQTICSGTVPAPLTSLSLPTGGTGTIEYIWLSSTTACPTAASQTIAGATSATYSPGALTQTTYFRRCARRAGCTAYVGESNCITITVGDNTNPVFATCPTNINLTTSGTTAVATYATPTATDNCSTPTVIRTVGLASGSAFPLGTTTVTHRATDAAGNIATCTFTVTVTQVIVCNNVTSGGTIGTNQTICSGTVPAPLTSLSLPTGGTGTIEYIWLSSTTACPTAASQTIAGATSATYSPSALTQTTYFRRCARRSGCTAYVGESNCITITVGDVTNPVFATCPTNINLTTIGTTAIATYATPTATDNCRAPWVTLTAGLASGSAFPLGTTRVTYTATDAPGNQATCSFTVTVVKATGCNNVTSGGTIGTNQTICYGSVPTTISSIAPASGGSGTIEYMWLKSTTSCRNSDEVVIAGATGETYSPSALRQTTYFRRCARRVGCTDWLGESNCITITVVNTCLGSANSVTQVSLDAGVQNSYTRLEWTANNGIQNDYFEVQRLDNNTGDFQEIETVNANNADNDTKYFSTLDKKPNLGENQYRVKLVGFDGKAIYSPIKTVIFGKTQNVLNVYPNPTDDYLNIDLQNYRGEAVDIYMYNHLGQKMQHTQIEKVGDEPIKLDVSAFTNGSYVIRVTAQSKRDVTKQVQISK